MGNFETFFGISELFNVQVKILMISKFPRLIEMKLIFGLTPSKFTLLMFRGRRSKKKKELYVIVVERSEIHFLVTFSLA